MEPDARLNHIFAGFLAGLLGTGVGFLLLALWWSWANGQTLSYFTQTVFLGSSLYKDSILTVSVLFNVAVFYGTLQLNWFRFARGVMLVMILSVLAILWLQTQSIFA